MLSKLQMEALENSCYVLGAGAFSVFIRWLQVNAGTTEDGLFEKGVWNYLVPLVIIVSLIIFFNMVKGFKKNRYYIDGDTTVALNNSSKFYKPIRIIIGSAMSVGGVLLIATCETELTAKLLYILGAMGVVCGISFIWLLGAFNDENANPTHMSVAATVPVLMFCFWLVCTYKANDINSVVWGYGIEIIAVCFTIFSFYRLAGFAFGSILFDRVMFSTMSGIYFLVVALADARNMGQTVMLVSAICMLLYYNWILITNFHQKEAPMSYQPRDGFDRL